MVASTVNYPKRSGLKRLFSLKSKSRLFGASLKDLTFCNISTETNLNHTKVEIPNLVYVCCNYIRNHGSETCGIFRVSGSLKRIQALQSLFDADPVTSADLQTLGFTPFDVAGLLTRFLKNLTEPIIPTHLFNEFRDHLDIEDKTRRLDSYRDLMAKLPKSNLNLLVYLLDFLEEMSLHSDTTLMTSLNLATVFQPSLLSLPSHNLNPAEYQLSQCVVDFLINHGTNLIPYDVIPLASSDRRTSTTLSMLKWLSRSNSTSSTLVDSPSSPTSTTDHRFSMDFPPTASSPPLSKSVPVITNNRLSLLNRTFSLRKVR